MESIIITPKNKSELEFISELLKKMKVKAKFLSPEEKEDLGLIELMKESDRTKTISRSKIMRKLKNYPQSF